MGGLRDRGRVVWPRLSLRSLGITSTGGAAAQRVASSTGDGDDDQGQTAGFGHCGDPAAGQLEDIQVLNATTGVEHFRLRGHTRPVNGVVFSPDGRRLASASNDRTIKLWNTMTGEELFTLRGHNSGVLSVAVSPDGHRLASGSIDMSVKIWDATPLEGW